MRQRDRRARWILSTLLTFWAASAPTRAAGQSGAETEEALVVRRADDTMTRTLRDAVRLATRWLANERCRQVFTDFRDSTGQTLLERLQVTRQTSSEYLHSLFFWDGAHEPACIWGDAFATTRPGTRVVHLCPAFKKLRLDKRRAAAIVIHEALHSLGLVENPPSSLEITDAVLDRCGK